MKNKNVLILSLIFGIAGLCGAAETARAAKTQEDGYEVTRTQTVTKAPRGSVGRKTTDREVRVGNTPETDGNSSTITMTVGGFAKKCPDAQGIVPGNFEFTVTADEVNTDEGETKRRHQANRMTARLEGHVDDEGQLGHVEGTVEFVRELSGTPTERRSFPIRFTPSRDGKPDYPAMKAAVEATADISAAILIWQAGQVFLDAQLEWQKKNACVEFIFDPPSETRSLGAKETAEVRVQLRTITDRTPVAEATLQIGVIDGTGTQSPLKGRTAADGTLKVNYTASDQPRRGHGLDVGSKSRAGYALDFWKIIEPGLVLVIEHRLADRRDTPAARMGQALFSGDVRFEAALKPNPQWPGRHEAELSLLRPLVVGHVTPQCTGSAQQREEWQVRAMVNPADRTLELDLAMFVDGPGTGSWVCRGQRDDLDVDVESSLEPVTMPGVTGTRRQFTIPRSDGVDETLTVTVKAGIPGK